MSKRDDIKLLLVWEKVTEEIIKKQKKIFGFSIFMIEKQSIKKIVQNVIQYFGPSLNKVTSVIEIPHSYLFWLIVWWMFLRWVVFMFVWGEYFTIWMGRTILDQTMDIILVLIVFAIIYMIFRKVQVLSAKKMKLLHKSMIFYNYSMDEAIELLLELDSKQNKKTPKYQSWGFADSLWGKWWLFAFSQPFIFFHGYFLSGFWFWVLVFYDIFVWLLLFQKMRIMIMYVMMYYFKIKFYFMDNFSFLFSLEIQERSFYKKLYSYIWELDDKLIMLELNVESVKKGIIQKNLWEWLSDTIIQIWKIYNLVDKSKYLKEKNKFHHFLKDLLNEAIDDYTEIFETIKKYKQDVINNNTKIPIVIKRLSMYQEQLEKIQSKIIAMKINI